MRNLTSKYQWAVLIGFYFGYVLLRMIARNNEALQPYLVPVNIGLALPAFSSWVINPISNLFFRFNKYGKLLLDRNEKMGSNFVAVSFTIFVIDLILYFAMRDDRFLAVAVFGFAMMLPFGVMFSPSKSKYSLLIYASIMALVGIGAVIRTFSTRQGMTSLFIIGFVAFQWVANYQLIKQDNQ